MTMRLLLLLRLLCSWTDLARSIALMVIGLILVPHFFPADRRARGKESYDKPASYNTSITGGNQSAPPRPREFSFRRVSFSDFSLQIFLWLRKSKIPETCKTGNLDTATSLPHFHFN